MEAHGQGVCNSHEDSIALRHHVVLLAADVNHHLLGLRRIDAEVGTVLLVHLGELVARDGVLGGDSIGRHVDLLHSHRHIGRTLGLEAEVTGHSLAIAASQLSIAGSIEVQAVGTVGAVV